MSHLTCSITTLPQKQRISAEFMRKKTPQNENNLEKTQFSRLLLAVMLALREGHGLQQSYTTLYIIQFLDGFMSHVITSHVPVHQLDQFTRLTLKLWICFSEKGFRYVMLPSFLLGGGLQLLSYIFNPTS